MENFWAGFEKQAGMAEIKKSIHDLWGKAALAAKNPRVAAKVVKDKISEKAKDVGGHFSRNDYRYMGSGVAAGTLGTAYGVNKSKDKPKAKK